MTEGMMALSVVTPQRTVLETEVRWVEIPAASGQMRALPGHAPTLGELGAGTVRYEAASGATQHLEITGGFFEVLAGKVTMLADTAAASRN